MTTQLEALQSQALIYKDQIIRDLCESLQLFYEQSFDTATVNQLRDAYHLLLQHGGNDVQSYAEPDPFMGMQPCHKDSLYFHDARGS